jgi:hypothetical protein
MPFGGYWPGWTRVAEIIIGIIVVLAIIHDPSGSAHWVQERAHNASDILHQLTVFAQNL